MEQMAMNGAASFLPEEIITNILKRLPVKSLIRFRCVCKHWKNHFKNPCFIADHLRHSSHHDPHFLFLDTFSYGRDNPTQLKLLNCQMQIRDLQKSHLLDSLRAGLVKIIGSRNGLVCFAISENNLARSRSSVFLWNPATTDAREVPRSRITDITDSCVFGFGFSPSLNDYKIVAIAPVMDLRLEVYSLSRDSWKEIEIENFSEHLLFSGDTTVSSNEAIFWKGVRSGGERGIVIVSFDLAKEVFTFIPWPTDTTLNTQMSFNFVNLTVYNGKLAIFRSGSDGSLWVTEEDIGSSRERWNWTKKFIGGHYPWMLNCVGTMWRNEIVMVGNTETRGQRKRLFLVNLTTTNEFKVIDIPQYCPTLLLTYVESLVPVFNIHNIEEP